MALFGWVRMIQPTIWFILRPLSQREAVPAWPPLCVRECKMWNFLLAPCPEDSVSFASPHPAPNAQHVFSQHASYSLPKFPHVTMHVISLQSRPATVFLCWKNHFALIKRRHWSHFAVTWPQLFMGISFPSQSCGARGLTRKAVPEEFRFHDPANWRLQLFVFLPFPGFCSNLPAAHIAALLPSLLVCWIASILGKLPGFAASCLFLFSLAYCRMRRSVRTLR